ncbi:hypothetical protein BCCGELA001_28660 [Bradyrhizobium sp. CCGE-LA001]|nr:hypothetical protein BCCGELA001_28660 [Bradyrhizobium sp. CCGE-LA001]
MCQYPSAIFGEEDIVKSWGCKLQEWCSNLLSGIVGMAGKDHLMELACLILNGAHNVGMTMTMRDDPPGGNCIYDTAV